MLHPQGLAERLLFTLFVSLPRGSLLQGSDVKGVCLEKPLLTLPTPHPYLDNDIGKRQDLQKVRSNYCVWKWHLPRFHAMIWQHLVSLIPALSSSRPRFKLTAFTVQTEGLSDRCRLSCRTDYSLCLTELGFPRLFPLHPLSVTDSSMMQMHVTCWGKLNYNMS